MNDHHTPPIDTPASSQSTVPLPPITPAWSVRPTYQYRTATHVQLHPPITAAQGIAVGSGLILALVLVAVWWISRHD